VLDEEKIGAFFLYRLIRGGARPGPRSALSYPRSVLDEEKIDAFSL
jgi:hypothetical protein